MKFEPDSEKLRVVFSQMGRFRFSTVFKLALSLLPILYSLYKFQTLDTTISNCYNARNIEVDVIQCIICNRNQTRIDPDQVKFGALHLNAMIGLVLYFYGVFIVVQMMREAHLSIKLMPYRTILIRNRWISHAYVFMGLIASYSLIGPLTSAKDTLIYNCYPVKLMDPILKMALVKYPLQSLWFIQRSLVQFLLMGSFISVLVSLLKDPSSMMLTLTDLVQHGFLFSQEGQSL